MVNSKYELWCKCATADSDLVAELDAMRGDEQAISDAFYKDLEFGTGGLRGVIGAGTNRMNIYTVGKATQGLAEYVKSVNKNGSVAIAYDSRIKSDVFAREAASILAANGIKVYIYSELMPTPMLSFAVRYLKCDAGIVVTASHNPAKYNGYKAYGADGCQMGLEAAEYVLSIMNKVDIFNGVVRIDFADGLKSGKIEYIGEDVISAYLDEVKARRVSADVDLSDFKVVYTPLHGSGNKPVRRILDLIGIKNVNIVSEQELPDGNFPTAPYPNPEIRQAFECALSLAPKVNPDILLATDPDCDRVGIAVNVNGEFRLMSGNDVGALLLDYILKRRKENGTLPENPVAVKTIVTSDLCKGIADFYGCELREVLTGFKFIGEQIGLLEAEGQEERYVFGFEESYGYLAGGYVRDKDAVVGSMLICEMAAYYKTQGKTLIDVLNEIYKKFGYFYCSQKSFTCEGQVGMQRIAGIMDDLRRNPPSVIAGGEVVTVKDFKTSESFDIKSGKTEKISLPASNVLGFYLNDGGSLIVRPSGTEPKIKLYISAVGDSDSTATDKRIAIENDATTLLGF
ncbi:MAG: phospho-sugar mutase [Clostridia bacterium]|nr:phospho-sugar mutase [Clostridia bacterium]